VSLLFTARGFRDTDYLAMLDHACADCPDLREIAVFDCDGKRSSPGPKGLIRAA